MQKNKPAVSVVAIYQSEAFIERCAVSLFEQDFNDIEYIFVDDASPDNSIATLEKVIARYPQRAEQMKIIRNVNNIGLFENRKKVCWLPVASIFSILMPMIGLIKK